MSPCLTLIVRNPHTLKTGIAHVDFQNYIQSLDGFFAAFGDDRLEVRLVGARFDEAYRHHENVTSLISYLAGKNLDIISSDIYGGNDGPSTVVVDPATFTIEEKVPGKPNKNEAASNAVMLCTRRGKPLIQQFDFTVDPKRAPIHLNARMLAEFREKYFGKEEWEIEGYMQCQSMQDRPLLVTQVHGLEQDYNEEWHKLQAALEAVIKQQGITEPAISQAQAALMAQSLYVGENAEAANAPVLDWINHRLFVGGVLQRSALKGPAADLNVYDPPSPPLQEVPARQQRRG